MRHYVEVPAANAEERERGLVDVYEICHEDGCKCVGEWLVVAGVPHDPAADAEGNMYVE